MLLQYNIGWIYSITRNLVRSSENPKIWLEVFFKIQI